MALRSETGLHRQSNVDGVAAPYFVVSGNLSSPLRKTGTDRYDFEALRLKQLRDRAMGEIHITGTPTYGRRHLCQQDAGGNEWLPD